MQNFNDPNAFAHIPKDILTDKRLSLQGKGLYSMICAFGTDRPVSLTQIADDLCVSRESIEPIWDEMISFMELKEKEFELQAAIEEMTQKSDNK